MAAFFGPDDTLLATVHPSLTELLDANPGAGLILIDIPIGLKSKGSDGRRCDRLARQLLGRARRSSVFSPPCRAAARAGDYDAACRINEGATGKKLSKQAWGIVPKITEVDQVLARSAELRTRVLEVHPEVLFWALNGGLPMEHRKSTAEGAEERLAVLERFAPEARSACKANLARWPRSQVAKDDVLDAFAAAITARLGSGFLETIPNPPEVDDLGIPMQMVYWRADASAESSQSPRFSLRPRIENLPAYAARYDAYSDEPVQRFLESPSPWKRLEFPDLLAIVRWKSRRAVPRARENEPDFVRAVTAAALTSSNERFRIQALLLLRGVGWPIASVVLHLCLREPYPILDFRALWSGGVDQPPAYDFGFWWNYVTFFRQLMAQSGLTARELDQALWQYSKEHQHPPAA